MSVVDPTSESSIPAPPSAVLAIEEERRGSIVSVVSQRETQVFHEGEFLSFVYVLVLMFELCSEFEVDVTPLTDDDESGEPATNFHFEGTHDIR